MTRAFIIVFSILLYTPYGFANLDDDKRFLAGVSINSQGHDFYIQYQESPEYKNSPIHNNFNRNQPDIKISFNNHALQDYIASYSGYRNVEGFENKKRKNDVKFAAMVVSIGLFTVAAGAFTIGAIINAIDD